MAALSLRDYLNDVGIKTAGAVPAAAPTVVAPTAPAPVVPPPAPVKVAAMPKNAPTKEDTSPKTPRKPDADIPPPAPHKSASIDPATATPEQVWLADRGVICPDAKKASFLYNQQVKQAEAIKYAELEKNAEEVRNQGALIYHGMVKEACVIQYANGEINEMDVMKVAAMIGVPAQSIIKRAEAMRAQMPSPALVGGELGRASHNESATQRAADENKNTTIYEPEAVQGTRQPVTGNSDPALHRFEDVWTLPGNPGLNMGMGVNQGKGS